MLVKAVELLIIEKHLKLLFAFTVLTYAVSDKFTRAISDPII